MSDRILLATRKGLFELKRHDAAASGWRVERGHFLGVQATMALHDRRDDAMYVALGHGHFGVKFHRSRDGGASWEELEAPKYPPKPDDVPDWVDAMRQKVIPWSLDMVWSLEAGGEDQPGRLWCGTLPGGLFVSDDHGESWELNRPLWDSPRREKWFGGGYDLPGIHSVSVNPDDSNHVIAAVSCGGVWVTRDGGRTWDTRCNGMRAAYMPPDQAYEPNVQDPHRLVQCPGSPDALWVQHHNGIFHTTDGGEQWTEIEAAGPSVFGFAVAVHPKQPGTAWFVPAVKDEVRVPVDGRFVVTRTSDGGRSFDVLSKGLPQENAYDIVYRHALEVDESGEKLVMGSTTGNVWTSRDGGDSWQHVTAHLPPVYAVRFA